MQHDHFIPCDGRRAAPKTFGRQLARLRAALRGSSKLCSTARSRAPSSPGRVSQRCWRGPPVYKRAYLLASEAMREADVLTACPGKSTVLTLGGSPFAVRSGPLGRLEVVNQPYGTRAGRARLRTARFWCWPNGRHQVRRARSRNRSWGASLHACHWPRQGAEREEETLEVRRLLPTKEKEKQADDT